MGRPQKTWHGFAGQAPVVRSLQQHCSGALSKATELPHILLDGPSGMGKTALAECVAKEMGVKCLEFYSSPQTKRWQLAQHLAKVEKRGAIVFVDEIHALLDSVQELLYPAIDRLQIPVVDADKHRIIENEWQEIPRFTLIAASDQAGRLKNALKQRLVLPYTLGHYTDGEMKHIVLNRAAEIGLLLSPLAANRIAGATRGVPRRARHLLESLHTCLEDTGVQVTSCMARKYLMSSRGIDNDHLTLHDRRYLGILRARGTTISLHDIARQVGKDEDSVREDIEPYLIRQGWVAVEPRGRRLTDAGIAYIERRDLR